MATVMLIEDNSNNVEIAVRFLNHGGFRSLVPKNAADALSLAQSDPPDVILMDLGLNEWSPPADGFELTTKLRQLPGLQDTPIIAVSAHSFEKEKEQAFEAGCNDFVEKPVDYLRLLQKLRDLVGEG